MAQPPMTQPDCLDPISSDRQRPGYPEGMPSEDLDRELDVRELAGKFATLLSGSLSRESTDLALEIVLNEITQQACLATRANGAAVLLERDGEMECRASSGENAPELGARLGGEPGLTAECIRTKCAQVCDDALVDPRVDYEASRHLGVRSVMVLPLLRSSGELAGVLEVFSAHPGAFGARDELTLQVLADRILRNLERVSESMETVEQRPRSFSQVVSISETPSGESSVEDWPLFSSNLQEELVPPKPASLAGRGLDLVTTALGVTVICVAVLLATLVALRLGWRRSALPHGQVSHVASRSPGMGRSAAEQATIAQPGATSDARAGTGGIPASAASGVNSPAGETKNTSAPASVVRYPFPPPGGLSVYENGKEVFRMPPVAERKADALNSDSTPASAGGVERASTVEKVDRLGISPEVAEESLLRRVEPDYPEEARQQGIQGPVVLVVRAGRDGSIQEISLVSGQRLLAEAAIAAVKQWRFKPLVVKGQPVEMQTTITLNFRLPH